MTTAQSIVQRPRNQVIALASPPNNPPVPPGTRLWTKPVLPNMTAWAVGLLNSPGAYPMFSTAIRQFGSDQIMARVEWHPWTYRNGVKITGQFRGITLYEVLAPWQYTSRGAVPGIAGSVDLNQFNGTLDDLHAYLTRTADHGDVKPGRIDLATVIGVQRAFNSLKVAEPPLIEDGVNGPKTRAAVRAFQRVNGLVVDGAVGERTRALLEAQMHLARQEPQNGTSHQGGSDASR